MVGLGVILYMSYAWGSLRFLDQVISFIKYENLLANYFFKYFFTPSPLLMIPLINIVGHLKLSSS